MVTNLLLKFNIDNYEDVINKLLIHNSDNSIYSGKCGAIIYLISLYDITNDKTILDKIKQIEENINFDTTATFQHSYAFFTGNMGVSITYLRLYKLLNDSYYLEKSIQIAKQSKVQISLFKEPVIDLINGVSGVLLGLLHIAKEGIRDSWLMEDIKFYVNYIVSKAQVFEFGIAWDRTTDINKCLTGFSHGSSGIGFVFNELYRITNIDSFYKIAQKSFNYENHYFDYNSLNWPDFRKKAFDVNSRAEFLNNAATNNIEFFKEKVEMLAWCHGAPGILLSRLNSKYQENFFVEAIESTLKSLNGSKNHSLCHSAVGNALCLITIVERSKNVTATTQKVIRKKIKDLCIKLIAFYESNHRFIDGYNKFKKNATYTLFMGEIGTFYFLLKASQYLKGKSIGENILYPSLREVSINLDLAEKLSNYSNTAFTFRELLKTKFPKTIYYLGDSFDFDESFLNNKNFKEKLILSKNDMAIDAFRYEEVFDNCKLLESYSYNFYRHIHVEQFLKKTNENKLLQTRVCLGNFKILETIYDWNEKTNPHWSNNKNVENKEVIKYIMTSGWKVNVLSLSEFTKLMISYLKNNQTLTIKKLIDLMTSQIKFDPTQSVEVKILLLSHVRTLISKAIISIYNERV